MATLRDQALVRTFWLIATFDFILGITFLVFPPPPSLSILATHSIALDDVIGVLLLAKGGLFLYCLSRECEYRRFQHLLLFGMVIWGVLVTASFVTLVGAHQVISYYGIPLYAFMFVHRFLLLSYVPRPDGGV